MKNKAVNTFIKGPANINMTHGNWSISSVFGRSTLLYKSIIVAKYYNCVEIIFPEIRLCEVEYNYNTYNAISRVRGLVKRAWPIVKRGV